MNAKKNKAVIKLSPQEGRVWDKLLQARKMNYQAIVAELYVAARDTTLKQAMRVSPRRRQLHIGTLVKRINTKQVKFVIKPGDEPSTYRMTRR